MKYLLTLVLALSLTASAQTTDYNPFVNQGAGATVVATRAQSITPHDGCTVLTTPNRAIWVGVEGNLKVKMYGGDTVTFVGVGAGSLIPISVQCILSTGTTATSIVILW